MSLVKEDGTAKTYPFTVRSLQQPQGHVACGGPQDLARKTKAERMLVRRAYSTPVYRPDNSDRAIGCFNAYVFKDSAIPEDIIVYIANVIGRIIAFHERLQPRVAAAYFAGQIAAPPWHPDHIFDLITRTVAGIINAETCSVFLWKPGRKRLVLCHT